MKNVIPAATAGALFVAMVFCASCARSECCPRFGELQGNASLILVRQAVDDLCYADSTSYEADYQQGRYWACILAVVERIEENRRHYMAENPNPHPVMHDFFQHSGHPWTFWARYARMGLAASDLDCPDVFSPEMASCLEEMRRVFVPVLEPGKTDDLLGIQTPHHDR